MTINRRRFLKGSGTAIAVTGLGTLAGCIGSDGGDDYPTKTIDFIVPFGAGGGSDIYARELTPLMEEELDGSIQVNNQPGGGQWVGLSTIATAQPDGHTIGTCVNNSAAIAALMNPPEVDPESLDMLCGFGTSHTMLVTSPEHDEFENDVEAAFDAVRDGTVDGTVALLGGSKTHIQADVLADEYDIPIEPVGYDGSADVSQAAASGETTFAAPTDSGAIPVIEEGTVIPVGAWQDTRSPAFPDTPSITGDFDYGMPNTLTAASTRPVVAHTDTPQDIKDQLVDATEAAVSSDEMQSWAEESGQNAEFLPPDSDILQATWEDTFETLPDDVDLSQY
ncbi:Bug family tripartite tricarboxylate transporter substrate binding protein [Natronorubrum sp. FCH18a]|uniref:Bug family tripartite tricarboxylate transporter substrate binding protein n=1 Tax=Natronorubrum sp. FCH18a TaxID=3447018 RepID=UPI003F515722